MRIALAPLLNGLPGTSIGEILVKIHPMRKVILSAAISIDGYIARPNGDVDFLIMPEDLSSMAEFFSGLDVILMGRKTYEVSLKMGGAPPFGGDTYVFSRNEPSGKRNGVIWTSEPPREFVDALRKNQGKNIFLMGGGELARAFLGEDLVDELHLSIVPSLLGAGIPLFPAGFGQLDLQLVECKSLPKGLVSLKYAVPARPLS